LGNGQYITVFDPKGHTTRVYTRDNEIDTFYLTRSDARVFDVGYSLCEVEIDPEHDPIFSDSNNLDSLRKHHQSILEHIQYRLGATDVSEPYAIENTWTMKVEDTIGTFQRSREENGGDWGTVVEKGKEKEEEPTEESICGYFMHPSIERERRLPDEKRDKLIAQRMEMITKETKERFQYRVNKQEVEKTSAMKSPEEIERVLRWERYFMELLLLYEVKEWEQLFWTRLAMIE
jgi:hypothetical protein